MKDDKFLLLNLEDSKSKDLAQVISSETSRKVLSLLSEKSYSETDIANKLNLPLPTAHYNIKHLLKAELVEIEDFLWSEKGKKIQLYKLANKLIIIAPSNVKSESFLNKLKDIVPAVLIGTFISIGIYVYQISNVSRDTIAGMQESLMSDQGLSMAMTAIEPVKEPNYAFWFFLGAISIVLLYLVYTYLGRKR